MNNEICELMMKMSFIDGTLGSINILNILSLLEETHGRWFPITE